MISIVYSQVNEQKLTQSLGMPEYSYYFVMKGFLPVLQELGEIVTVDDPEKEVDAIYENCRRRGEKCVFFSFSPPNKSVTGLRCPTVCVLAWEFDRIPDEAWDDNPKNDWRTVFKDHGRAITLSHYSAKAVKRAMGEDFRVEAIPVPVWDLFEDHRKRQIDIVTKLPQKISLKGNVIDSRNYIISSDSFELKDSFHGIQIRPWPGGTLKMGFAETDSFSAYLGGFYKPEPWGTWSRIEAPWILIPYSLTGKVKVKITLCGYEKNAHREISVSLGAETKKMTLNGGITEAALSFHLEQPANILKFSGLDLSPVPGARDPRSMGIGMRSMELTLDDIHQIEAFDNVSHEIFFDEVVYTSVFNPGDDRKNWTDMIRGFGIAFRDIEDATLILKMTHHSVTSFLGTLHCLLQQMYPFKCRIIAIHGYLDQSQYENLIQATSFYVNTSRCEGLCLPLMEFMSCGKPSIAPCNTALADYIDNSTTLIVKSSVEPGIWPHDPRQLFRALRYRISWESLVDAYRQSYEIAKNQPDRYVKMANAAILKMQKYSSYDAVKVNLTKFLDING